MRDRTYPTVIRGCRTAFKALGQHIELSGLEHVPTSGGFLLASNHVSYVDFVYAGLAAVERGRLPRFMAKRELFRAKGLGAVMRSMHHIEVDRDEGAASFRTALKYLKDGEAVGIFPEATISRAYELKEFKTGAVRIAAEAGVPIVPTIVWGTQRLAPKGRKRDYTRGRTISISVGAPLTPSSTDPEAETAALKAAMAALLDTAIRTHPDQEPNAWWVPASYGGSAPTLAQAQELEAEDRRRRLERRLAERNKKSAKSRKQ